MLRIFIGTDNRQPVAANVLQSSLYATSTQPLAITQLRINQLPLKRMESTEFTYTRWLVPWLCEFKGWALFMDADMVCLSDISKLFDLADPKHDVMVVKGPERFEWPSLMLFNCEKCVKLTPEYLEDGEPATFDWAHSVGGLPHEWNFLVGYDKPREQALVLHYTLGIPLFPEVRGFGHEVEWFTYYHDFLNTCSWLELMGDTVHAQKVMEFLRQKCLIHKQNFSMPSGL